MFKNPYSHIPIEVWLLAAVSLISKSGSMVLVFLPLYLTQQLNFDVVMTGRILSMYGLGTIIGAYMGGILVDRFGSLKVQIFSLFLAGVLYLLLEFLALPSAILITMLCIGALTSAIRPANSSTIVQVCTPKSRPKAFSINYQAINIGNTIGPAVGGMLAGISYLLIFRVDGIANILAAFALFIFFHKRNKLNLSSEIKSLATGQSPWKDYSFLIFLMLAFLIGLCFFQIFTVYPIFLKQQYHLSEFDFGLVMSANGILIVLLQTPIVSRMGAYSTIRLIGLGGFLISMSFFILPFYHGFYYALFSMLIFTVGEVIALPLMNEFVANLAPEASRGNYFGLFSLAFSSPLLIAPYFASSIYQNLGENVLWYCMGLLGSMILIGSEWFNAKASGNKIIVLSRSSP